MRIAIVNDLFLAVETLRRSLKDFPGYSIAWVAKDGAEAVEKAKSDTPDLILMDLIMPVMDGVEATRRIMLESPCAILVVTATVEGNAAKVFEAMGFGALDAVCTPVVGNKGKIDGADELFKKMTTIAKLISREKTEIEIPQTISRVSSPVVMPHLIVIGASTGGPKVLSEIISKLPAEIGCSIIIIQHIDEKFAKELSLWFGSQTKLKVKIAENGMHLEKNIIYIAGKNEHLEINHDFRFQYNPEPRNNPYIPSVDSLFLSLKNNWHSKDLAILLTGMGRDGANGLLELRKAGWLTVAQDEKSSVVYGMPKAAADLGAAVEILNPAQISNSILKFIKKIKVT